MDSQIERSRFLRQGILKVLFVHDQCGLEIGYTAALLAGLNADSVFGASAMQTAAELRDLLERKLVRKVEDANPPRFVLSADGRDFCRAEFPWAAIDRFSGKKRPGENG